MNLVIDIGNTRIKAAVFEKSKLIDSLSYEENLSVFLKKYIGKIQQYIVSSVAEMPKNLKKQLKLLKAKPLEFNSDTPVPFKNNYSTKNTL